VYVLYFTIHRFAEAAYDYTSRLAIKKITDSEHVEELQNGEDISDTGHPTLNDDPFADDDVNVAEALAEAANNVTVGTAAAAASSASPNVVNNSPTYDPYHLASTPGFMAYPRQLASVNRNLSNVLACIQAISLFMPGPMKQVIATDLTKEINRFQNNHPNVWFTHKSNFMRATARSTKIPSKEIFDEFLRDLTATDEMTPIRLVRLLFVCFFGIVILLTYVYID